MSKIYEMKCDKCGLSVDNYGPNDKGWKNVKFPSGCFDLCPSCVIKFDVYVDAFMVKPQPVNNVVSKPESPLARGTKIMNDVLNNGFDNL